MKTLHRLWHDEEIMGTLQTIQCLRQMRTAATLDTLPITLKTRNLVRRVVGGDIIQLGNPQLVLAEAERLADRAADYFAHSLHKKSETKGKYELWRDHLSEAEKTYEDFDPTSFANTSPKEVIISIMGALSALRIDPDHLLHNELVTANHLGFRRLEHIGQVKSAVIAPLSGDYLLASTFSKYLGERGQSFSTHAVALSPDLTKAVFPSDLEARLADIDSIGIYLDTVQTGRTGSSLHQKLQDKLDGKKIVHAPNSKKVPFKESPETEAFWKSYEAAQNP